VDRIALIGDKTYPTPEQAKAHALARLITLLKKENVATDLNPNAWLHEKRPPIIPFIFIYGRLPRIVESRSTRGSLEYGYAIYEEGDGYRYIVWLHFIHR